MLLSTMWFGKNHETSSNRGFQIGPISFKLQSLVISVYTLLIVVPIGFILLSLIKSSRKKNNRVADIPFYETDDEHSKKYVSTSRKYFPWWSVIVGYFLVAFIILCSTFVTLLYCMDWGTDKASAWLQSFFLSIAESEGVVSPVKVIFLIPYKRAYNSHNYEFYKVRKKEIFCTSRT